MEQGEIKGALCAASLTKSLLSEDKSFGHTCQIPNLLDVFAVVPDAILYLFLKAAMCWSSSLRAVSV